GIYSANMLSNSFGEFSLHLDHVKLEQAGDRRGAKANLHSYSILMVLQALTIGHKAIADHLGLVLPPEENVNFPYEGTSSESDQAMFVDSYVVFLGRSISEGAGA
ncbi:hypothetical protein KI387_043572, partial [Taxus chinensis]